MTYQVASARELCFDLLSLSRWVWIREREREREREISSNYPCPVSKTSRFRIHVFFSRNCRFGYFPSRQFYTLRHPEEKLSPFVECRKFIQSSSNFSLSLSLSYTHTHTDTHTPSLFLSSLASTTTAIILILTINFYRPKLQVRQVGAQRAQINRICTIMARRPPAPAIAFLKGKSVKNKFILICHWFFYIVIFGAVIRNSTTYFALFEISLIYIL